jgi:TatD DNase family protein
VAIGLLMIDTHAHIYLPELENDRKQVIFNAHESGIQKILMPAIDSTTHEMMLKVEKEFMECIPMIGLHPCSVKENYKEELSLIKEYLSRRTFVAIGEIGLDFYWDTTFNQQQYDAFNKQVLLSLENSLPIVIHSRNAMDECIEVVRQYPTATGVFHCFSGTEQQARQIIDLGFMLGIGGVITFKNAGLDKVIKLVGINNVILETDAPYLAPVPFRGKRNEPAYTKLVAKTLSAITGYTLEEIERITTDNAVRLFDLK